MPEEQSVVHIKIVTDQISPLLLEVRLHITTGDDCQLAYQKYL